MTCPSCAHANPEGARFCNGCGAPVTPRCQGCGAENPPGSRFCNGCGAQVVAPPAKAAQVRKVVTIVFADLIGSTALHERLDPESVSRVMERYHRAVREPIEGNGGTVVHLLGDGVMCAFGVPHVAEDDAIRAVRAAVGIQRAFEEFARAERAVVGHVGLRVAVNTGEVVVSADHTDVVGDPVNVAARLQQEAHDGDVLVGESTERLVRQLMTLEPFGVFALKGRAETVAAYRVVSLERPAGVPATPFVGRDGELRRVMAVHEAAVAERRARLAVVLGSPGLGKSRLLAEVARRLGDGATVLTAQCDAAGGATFAPLAGALRAFLRTDDAGDAVRVALDAVLPGDEPERARIGDGIAAVLAGTPASPEETFFVVRRFLAALAATQPVVLAIDDLQWAEPLLLDLIEHLVQWSTGVPLLLLAAARPELRDARSSLATPGGLVADVVTLRGLDAGAATRLAANVVGGEELPAAIAGRVLAASEGNPLFVGELVRMLVHDGVLKREGDRWTTGVEVSALEMPPTIQALLAARIERLGPEERAVLERAAVVGRQFSRAAVSHLLPRELGAQLDARLESLRRSELIERDTGWLLGEPVLRFHHVLIRDAAYRRVLKGTRAELHGRLADWIESRVGDAVEHDETIGWHLEQAHQNLRELGPIDANGRTLGDRAARYLGAAGRRALARDDLPLASSLLGRALDRLDPGDPARADLALDWCEALLAAGDVGPAAGAIDELGRFTEDSDRLRAWHTCFAGQRAALTDPQALRPTVDAVTAAADALAAVGDAAGEAKAHSVLATALARLGKVGECEAALDRALAAARRGHDRRRQNTVLAGAPLAALWGPSPVTRASGRCLDVVRVLRITQGSPAVEAMALRCQAVLEALRGRGDAARRMLASSRRMVEELGITQQLLEADVFAGFIELVEGDAVAAEQSLRGAYDGLRAHGLGIDAASAAAFLGRALLAQDRVAEAETLSHEGEALAGDDLQAALAWRGVRAEALARRGEHAAAVDVARTAVDIAAATDALLHHADARVALAVALRAAGRRTEAAAEEARAIELWEAKGATLLTERARREAPRVVERTTEERAEPAPPVRRRVRANAATAFAARQEAAVAARDVDAFPALFADDMETVHHPTGAVYDRQGAVTSLGMVCRARDAMFRLEPLATLGDSLALCRQSVSASGAHGKTFDIGPYEGEWFALMEVDGRGQSRRTEIFAENRLDDAVARLYERYAELLPDGRARDRAAATARSVAAVPGPMSLDGIGKIIGPDVEFVDHRPVGLPSSRGREAYLRLLHAFLDLVDDAANRVDDVLGLRPDAFLLRVTNFGTDHTSGGAFERPLHLLSVFDADGLVTHWEFFDPDHDVEALARFDALTAEPSRAAARRVRRVRPNAATANVDRQMTAFAARDIDALLALFADDVETIHHPTGVTYDRRGVGATWRSFFRAEAPAFRMDVVATLGDSLALCRTSISFSALGADDFAPFGAVEKDQISLVEVDAEGRRQRTEHFAVDRMEDALVRMYERYADLLPDGPARERAAATARSIAALRDRAGLTVIAPDVEFIDHRILGFGSARGAEAVVRWGRSLARSLAEVADNLVNHGVDVVDLRPDARIVRWTLLGSDRAGGGTFEIPILQLEVFGADGLITRIERFDADHEAEALARFDALVVEPPVTPRITNAATRVDDRLDDAWAARDWERITAMFPSDFRLVDHRTLGHLELDRERHLESLRFRFEMRSSRLMSDVLATRGDRLNLGRSRFELADGDVGPSETESLYVREVDEHGGMVAVVMFDPDDLDAAYAELDRRYAAGEAAPYARTWETMQRVKRAIAARAIGALDWEALAPVVAPDFVAEDHRLLGGGWLRTFDEIGEAVRALVELAPDAVSRNDHVLALDDRRVLSVHRWVGTRDGGAFEIPSIIVALHGPDGVRRLHLYDLDRLDAARACYEALGTTPATTPPIENAATRCWDRFDEAWAAHDWERVAALFGPGYRLIDRRAIALLELERGPFLESMRPAFEQLKSHHTQELLATRGDRLALFRVVFHGAGGAVGPSEVEWLELDQVDEHGLYEVGVMLDARDLDAAYAELDERYAAGEGARYPYARAWAQPVATWDWDALAAQIAPDHVLHDHRAFGWETTHGVAGIVDIFKSLVELAPDARVRTDHFTMSARGAFMVGAWVGTREGGTFEAPRIGVQEFDDAGRWRRLDLYDPGQIDQARARFEAIDAGRRRDPLAAFARPNAATAARDRVQVAFEARDWAAVRVACREDATFEDRRRLALLSGDREWWVAYLQSIAEGRNVRLERRLVATFGDRIDLQRGTWRGGPTDGPFEIEFLAVTEADEAGNIAGFVAFDVDDWRAAEREARARWFARDARAAAVVGPDAEFIEASNAHDRTRARAVLADDFVVDDHRRAGMGLIEGADAYVDSLVALWDLAPDIQFEPPVRLALDRYGLVQALRGFGTLREGGGAFERLHVSVAIVASGRITRLELFDIDAVDAALARFAELRPDPLRIPPNAATRASDRVQEAGRAQDWDALRALCAPELEYDDRRRGLRSAGDREMYLASMQHIFSGRARAARTVLATSGDRLALERVLWTGPEDAAPFTPFEIEVLSLREVDAEGRLVAVIVFDPDERRGACAELFERYVRSDAGRWMSPKSVEFRRAVRDHDVVRIRAALPDDFLFHDHRRTGAGRLEGADSYVAWLAALFEQSADAIIEPLYYVAWGAHGFVAVGHTFGTNAEGGEFESVFVQLGLNEGAQPVGAELFELDDLDVALARFEELRPDPTRIPPNAACRARARLTEAVVARDWPALRALARPDFAFEDRRKRAMLTGDVELYIKNAEFVRSQPHLRITRELLGTAGDRIAIERIVWAGGPAGGEFENDILTLVEVDADGRLVALIDWDADDRRVALWEGYTRFVAGAAAATGGRLSPLLAWARARDWVAARSCLADDFVLHDHRQLGLGTLGGDEWVESLRVMDELTPGWRWETFRIFAWNRHGSVDATRQFGTIRDGGAFENVFIRVIVTDGDRIRRNEVFAIDDVDRALARFEELCADPT